nr:glycosyltransferase [Rhizobium sp. ERR1071]
MTGLNVGGAERLMQTLIAKSDRSRFKHNVVSLTSIGALGQQLLDADVPVSNLGLPSMRTAVNRLSAVRRVLSDADVIHTWMYHANLIGGALKPRGRPLLWSLHATELEAQYTKVATRMMVTLGQWLSRSLPQETVYCSPSSKAYHAHIGYDMSRAVIINNGIDTARFQSSASDRQRLRAAWNLDGKIVIGNVARWHPQKDHATLLEAFAQAQRGNNALHLVLVGDGLTAENVQLVALIRKLNIEAHVSLVGLMRDIPAVLSALDIFIMSSAFGEALPLALCEAMACKLPAIVTNVGECPNVVANCGWVVPPAEANQLAKAMEAASGMPEAERAAMGSRAREHVLAQFDIEDCTRHYEELYVSLRRNATN